MGITVRRCRAPLDPYGFALAMRDDPVETTNNPTPALSAGASSTVADWTLFAVITLVGAALRLFAIEQWSFGVEEAETFRAVTQPIGASADGFAASDESRFPLGFLLLRWLLGNGVLPGSTEGWMRLPFAFAGCLLPPLMALLTRPMFGRGVAFFVALLIAVHPAHIAASQSAAPVVCAVTLAAAAGVAAKYGWRYLSWSLVVLAGGCHAIGWLAAIGMLCTAANSRTFVRMPRFVGWVLGLHVVVLVPALIQNVGLSVVLLALLALVMRPTQGGNSITRGLSLAALFPLVGGGVWWWFDRTVSDTATLAALPAMTLLASWSVVRFFHRMRLPMLRHLTERRLLTRVLALAPAIMLLSEVLTATFLYFVVYAGGRPPWRDVRDAVLASLQPGHKIEVVAARGCNVMRAYLRPSHWRVPPGDLWPSLDPHPGIRVSMLPADLEAARAMLASPDVLLVLQREEWSALLAAEGGAELVADFVKKAVWPCPQPWGDHAIYLLQRRVPAKND